MTTPFNNLQPSLAIQEVTLALGIFPAVSDGGGVGYGDTIGFIYGFAGDFAPYGSLSSDGQQIQISSNTALFSILGTTYGGNGTSNYDLPDLEGQAIIGAGGGYTLGEMTGSSTLTLTPSNLPTGGGQPFDNLQPSLPIETLICTGGVFPTQGGASGSAAFIGEIANFAGNIVPEGWALANGQSMSIGSNSALFSVIGTLYGGNGTSNFDLPNLQGKVAVGSGADGGIPVGTLYGEASTTLTSSELPPVSAPIDDDQPSLAVEYLIAIAGIFPSQGGGGSPFNANTPTLGQIVEFAGNFVPSGYALANGELLPIKDFPALFAVIGTTYGGDGVTDFALPDFTGRTAIGAGGTTVEGEESGADTVTLTADNIPACYLEGTRIMTVAGEVAIEMLRIGDRVVTASGGTRGIVWTGHRRVDVARHRRPRDVQPIRVRADAFAPGRPRRDLVLSPDHAVVVDGALIPVRYLLNGATIVQEPAGKVTWWHLELDAHDVVLAEGLPAESYLDTGNRSAFEGGAVVQAHPDFAREVRARAGCAELVFSGARLERVRAALLDRIGGLGYATTNDPGLRLLTAGHALDSQRYDDWMCVVVPDDARSLRVVSRTAHPAELHPHSHDWRRLGVTLVAWRMDGVDMPLDHGGFRRGWLAAETGMRWTDGDATLDVAPGSVVELCVPRILRYHVAPQSDTLRSEAA